MGMTKTTTRPPREAACGVLSCAPFHEAYRPLRKRGVRPEVAMINLNFLDRPMFIPARKLNDPVTGRLMPLEECRTYNDGSGFEIQALVNTELKKDGFPAFFGLPSFFDKKVLYALAARLPIFESTYLDDALSIMQGDTEGLIRRVDVVSVRELAREIGIEKPDGRANKRIKESLLRWGNLILSFHNNTLTTSKSADGDTIRRVVETTRIPVIDRIDFVESERGGMTKASVTFNKAFLLCNNDSFTRRLCLQTFYSFTRPTSARLYEVLCKNFWGGGRRARCPKTGAMLWRINTENLTAKLGSNNDRNTQRDIRAAINEINERAADLLFSVEFGIGAEGQSVATFSRRKVAKAD